MDWLLDHIQVLFLVAVAIVAILQKLKSGHPEGADDAPLATDPEAAERTRRIQEEIRRRILERRGLSPVPAPETEGGGEVPMAPPRLESPRPLVTAPQPTGEAAPAFDYTPELERQRQLLQRLRDVVAMQDARESPAPSMPAGAAIGGGIPTASPRPWSELRHPAGLRRAVVWREILGPPVGLR